MNWNKCSEILPDQDERVLCTNEKHEFYVAYYSRNPTNYDPGYFDSWDSGFCCGREPNEPTYWMKLPENPYLELKK